MSVNIYLSIMDSLYNWPMNASFPIFKLTILFPCICTTIKYGMESLRCRHSWSRKLHHPDVSCAYFRGVFQKMIFHGMSFRSWNFFCVVSIVIQHEYNFTCPLCKSIHAPSANHITLLNGRPRCYTKPPTVQDMFQTSWGIHWGDQKMGRLLSHTKNKQPSHWPIHIIGVVAVILSENWVNCFVPNVISHLRWRGRWHGDIYPLLPHM